MLDGKMQIQLNNTKIWLNENQEYHRLRNRPAYVSKFTKMFYLNGKLHRTNGPAHIYKDRYNNGYGFSAWHQNDLYYRENGFPTIEYSDGRKEWHVFIAKDSRNYAFYIWTMDQKHWRIRAGCRNFTVKQATKHWGKNGKNNKEAMALVKRAIVMIAEEKTKIAAKLMQPES